MTYAKRGPEAIAAAMVAMLQANLPAELTAVQASYADTIPLIAPKGYHLFERGVEGGPFPIISVEPQGGPVRGASPTEWAQVEHRLLVVAWLMSDQLVTVKKQTARYVWALWQAFMKHPDLDGSLGAGLGTYPTQYQLDAVGQGKSFLGACQWQVTVTVAELVQS